MKIFKSLCVILPCFDLMAGSPYVPVPSDHHDPKSITFKLAESSVGLPDKNALKKRERDQLEFNTDPNYWTQISLSGVAAGIPRLWQITPGAHNFLFAAGVVGIVAGVGFQLLSGFLPDKDEAKMQQLFTAINGLIEEKIDQYDFQQRALELDATARGLDEQLDHVFVIQRNSSYAAFRDGLNGFIQNFLQIKREVVWAPDLESKWSDPIKAMQNVPYFVVYAQIHMLMIKEQILINPGENGGFIQSYHDKVQEYTTFAKQLKDKIKLYPAAVVTTEVTVDFSRADHESSFSDDWYYEIHIKKNNGDKLAKLECQLSEREIKPKEDACKGFSEIDSELAELRKSYTVSVDEATVGLDQIINLEGSDPEAELNDCLKNFYAALNRDELNSTALINCSETTKMAG